MNTPSPLVPQGAIPPRPRNSLYFKILMVLSVHVVVIGGMLLQGCKDTSTKDQAKQDASSPVTSDTTSVPVAPPNTATPSSMDSAPVANPSLSNTSAIAPLATAPLQQPPPAPNTGMVPPATSTDLAPPAAPGEAKEYVIAKGDTFAVIARRNGVSLKALMEANPGVNARKLRVGQKVQIPGGGAALAKETAPGASAEGASVDGAVYVVKSGDMLLKIAKRHGTTVKKIMAMNDLKTTSIRVGQKLKLPAAKTSSTESAGTPATATAATVPSAAPMKVSATSTTGSPVAAN